MTEQEFKFIQDRCDNIRREAFQIGEKDYFLMAIGCVIDNWSREFGYDPGEVALEICQLVHMKEKKDGLHKV